MSDLIGVIGPEIMFCFSGILLFASWLLKTSLGRHALRHAPVRRNALTPTFLLVLLLVWQVLPSLLIWTLAGLTTTLPEWQAWIVRNSVMCLASLLTILLILIVVWRTFVRGFKGFGLGVRRLHIDLAQSVVVLFTLLPLVLAAIALTTYVGRRVDGPEFQIEQHGALDVLIKHPQVISRLLVVLLAVVAAPLVEEMLFRGILQSLLRSYIDWPWLAVGVCSVLFAAVHVDIAHMPALFVLSLGIGYAYEKSGSLWQAIFVHAMFNGWIMLNVYWEGYTGA